MSGLWQTFLTELELIGWVVFGVSALLLVIAHHIDNYQSPPPANAVQTSSLSH
ncbi:division septum protein Blr [Raoultella planticola]|nr:division septum protein Blr [Raoultella planticola]